eukprot:g1968.t1
MLLRKLGQFCTRVHFSTNIGPLERYNQLVQSNRLNFDAAQASALEPFQRLHRELVNYSPKSLEIPSSKVEARKTGFFSAVTNFFATAVDSRNTSTKYDPATRTWNRVKTSEDKELSLQQEEKFKKLIQETRKDMPLGVYIHGGVGCGKTMLMDMFYKDAPCEKKRRVHFHAFMLEVHNRMHELRKRGESGDPIPRIVKEISDECILLCFDEFQVTDVADALVMRRLFSGLMDMHGVIVVATSNRPPDDLYNNGIQRDLFLPFIDRLKELCEVHDMDSKTDFRLLGTGSDTMYMTPSETRDSDLENLFGKLTKGTAVKEMTITCQGRLVKAPNVSENGVARFTFAELCLQPRGASDYIALSQSFHTFFITDVPKLTSNDVNPTRRFITLIDALYEARAKVIITADELPENLLEKRIGEADKGVNLKGDLLGTADYVPFQQDEAFAFDRTVSRLNEMQSVEYLLAAHRQDGSSSTTLEFLQDNLFERSVSGKNVIMREQIVLSEAELKNLFDSYDADFDSKLSRNEMQLLLEDLTFLRVGHRNVEIALVDAAFDSIDKNHDGRLDFEEFQEFANDYGLSSLKEYLPTE